MDHAIAPVSSAEPLESPDHVRLSLAAAMTLGFVPGWFYRNARLGCINLLLTYNDGCRANCAFCGLAAEKREQDFGKSFIRVPWKKFPTDDVIEAVTHAPAHVSRVCVSMITHPRCKADVLNVCRKVVARTGKPVSLLISPTLLTETDLHELKDCGADRIGVAIDAATPQLFDRLRGKPAHGPHRWKKYWSAYEQCLEIFGEGMAGVHLICGLGETEQEMVAAIQRARDMGGCTHLFSFFPEKGSAMERTAPPLIDTYRRIQLSRWLIDHDRTHANDMAFDAHGRIEYFGVSDGELEEAVSIGAAFQTSGCPGPDGTVACNRPYGNEKPGNAIRNFPFPPEAEDLERVRQELRDHTSCHKT